MKITNTALIVSSISLLAACAPVETKTTLTTPVTSQVRTAGPGDVVMSFQSRRSLPNIVGKADLFGRTTNAGGTTVRFVGIRGQQAVFERSDVDVESNATTMTESPMVIPQTTTTNISGTYGNVPVSGTATSRSYQFIPPRGSSQYAVAQRPIYVTLGRERSVTFQGRTLKVVGLTGSSVSYVVE